MARKLEGKVAIITGGASGIGEETARLFAKNGAQVIIADVQDQLGQALAESIGSNICSYVHCDVSSEDQVKATVEWTVKTHGKLDIMFSNAGIFSDSDQTVVDLDLFELERVFSVNVRGMASCVKQAARVMMETGKGSIVCTASVAASRGSETWTDYYMSKHAVLGLMRCASKQLGKYGIRVNCVSPFGVATPMVCSSDLPEAKEEFEKRCEPLTSLKGNFLRVNHIADAVLFLASDDSAFISGHDLLVDGGFSA